MQKTLLIALSHPDDEVGCAGTIAIHAAAGHRVVMLFLTRGEMTESLGISDAERVAEQRMQHARDAGDIIGASDVRFLDFPDTRIEVSADGSYRVAKELAQIAPDAVITWGDAWVRGPRHPDHQATGQLVRNAITLARIARAVKPHAPHRAASPVFTLRDAQSTLTEVAVDVTSQLAKLHELADYYRAHGVPAAELFDAWETPGGLVTSLMDLVPEIG